VLEYYLEIGHSHFLKHPFYLILITIFPYGTDMYMNPQTKHYRENNCFQHKNCPLKSPPSPPPPFAAFPKVEDSFNYFETDCC
jgi:hypothetical protein